MKKNIIFFTLLIFTIPIFSQDGYKVTYYITEPKPYGSIDNLSVQAKQLSQKILNVAENVRYTLFINKKNSYFKVDDFFSIGESTALDDVYFNLAKDFASFNEEVYVNYDNKQITFVSELVEKEFTVKTGFINLHWQLIDEEKTIANLNTYKAIGTYFDPIKKKETEIIAWYAPSIPLSGGPDIFIGLPGLIVEIELKGAIVSIKKLQEVKNIEINKINDSTAMNFDEYNNLIEDLTGKFIDNN